MVLWPDLSHTSLSVPRTMEGTQKHYCSDETTARLNQHQAIVHVGCQSPGLDQLLLLRYSRLLWFIPPQSLLFRIVWFYSVLQ